MPRFYFDTQDNATVVMDYLGLEFDNLQAVKEEAARGLTDLARYVLPGAKRRVLAILVRDEAKRPLLEARLVFEISQISFARRP